MVVFMLFSLFVGCKKDDSSSQNDASGTKSASATAKPSAGKASGTSSATNKQSTTGGGTQSSNSGNTGNTGSTGNSGSGSGGSSSGGSNDSGNNDYVDNGNQGGDGDNTGDYKEIRYDFNGRKFVYYCPPHYEVKEGQSDPAISGLVPSFKEASEWFNATAEANVFQVTGTWVNDMIAQLVAGIYIGDWTMNLTADRLMPAMMSQGLIIPLDEYIDFNDPIISQMPHDTTVFAGKHWGFIWNQPTANLDIVYNKDIFAREGLPDLYELQESGQWTWEALINIAQSATKDTDGDGVVDQWGFDNTNYLSNLNITAIISNFGNTYVFDHDKGEYVSALSWPQSIQAIQFISDLQHVYKVMPVGQQMQSGNANPYYKGKAAMAFNNRTIGDTIKQRAAFPANSGFVVFPKGPMANDYRTKVTTYYIGVFYNAKNPEEVGKFISRAYVTWDPDKAGYRDPKDIDTSFAYSENDINTYWRAMSNVVEVYNGIANTQGHVNNIVKELANGLKDGISATTYIQARQGYIDENLSIINEAVKNALKKFN